MTNKQKQKLILDFINGPLQEYLQGDISFGKFKERINEVCGTQFCYSDIYPSYLFNAKLAYYDDQLDWEENTIINDKVVQECLDIIPGTFIACGEGFGNERQYCSTACWEKAKKK